MTNSTERAEGFGPLELRTGVGDFPGWRGLQRTGDTVLKPGRFFRLWNAQLNDGAVECRGGQLLLADMGTDEARPQCITSVFSTNVEWPDLGQEAEIRFTDPVPVDSVDEIEAETSSAYRGDTGQLSQAVALTDTTTKRQHWLRDGADNTTSGRESDNLTNTSVRHRDRVYTADLDGGVRYLTPGSATYTVLLASGDLFPADSRPLAMVFQTLLVVCAIDLLATYNRDTGTWTPIAMPGGTTGFIPAGWTVFDVNQCLYIWGTITAADAVLIKFDGTTTTLTFTAAKPPGVVSNVALDCASQNGRIVLSYIQQTVVTDALKSVHGDDGIIFADSTLSSGSSDPVHAPTRMCVADSMIWSIGASDELSISEAPLIYSYDGSEWLEVLLMEGIASASGVLATNDIVQIAPVDNTVSDTTGTP